MVRKQALAELCSVSRRSCGSMVPKEKDLPVKVHRGKVLNPQLQYVAQNIAFLSL